MLISYISEPKDWSPGNAEVSPCFYLSIQDPTEKCPVLLNQCFSMNDEENMMPKICEPS